jgi:protein-tyrosine phosphatase
VIDLHAHLLPALDDGPATLVDSVQLARLLEDAGVRTVAATPHVRADYPNEAEQIGRALDDVRSALREAGLALEVLPGAELAFDALTRPIEELRRFGLGGKPSVLLVETPYVGWPLGLESKLFELRLEGLTTVLAHPERNSEVHADPARIERLVSSGTRVQLTTSSLAGKFGNEPRKTALELLDRGLAHLVASDTHGRDSRTLGAAPVARILRDDALAHWLTEEVPAAVMAGAPIPERPRSASRPRFAALRRRRHGP